MSFVGSLAFIMGLLTPTSGTYSIVLRIFYACYTSYTFATVFVYAEGWPKLPYEDFSSCRPGVETSYIRSFVCTRVV